MRSISEFYRRAVYDPEVYTPEEQALIVARDNAPPPTPEDDLMFAACNERIMKFHHIASQGQVDFKKLEADERIISMIANSGIDGAIWVAENSRRLGISLDRQDSFDCAGSESMHDYIRSCLDIDIDDRLGWQDGVILKNTALILSVKKGWDHVSVVDRDGNPIDRENPPRFFRNKTKMGRATVALLRNGANPDIQDGCGNTALHIAVMHRDIRQVMALRDAGASKIIRNNAGLRPIDILKIEYSDINPFLYQQTGNDVNCYIFTLKDRKSWLASGAQIRAALLGWPRKAVVRIPSLVL